MKTKMPLFFFACIFLSACLGPKLPKTPEMPKFDPKYEVSEDTKRQLTESGKKLMKSLGRLFRTGYFNGLVFQSKEMKPVFTGTGVWTKLPSGQPDHGYKVQFTLTVTGSYSFNYVEFQNGQDKITHHKEINGQASVIGETMYLQGLGFITAGQNSEILMLTTTAPINERALGTLELSSTVKTTAHNFNAAVNISSNSAIETLNSFAGTKLVGDDFSGETECHLEVSKEKGNLVFKLTEGRSKKKEFVLSPNTKVISLSRGTFGFHALVIEENNNVTNLSIGKLNNEIFSITLASTEDHKDTGFSDRISCWFN